MINATPILNSIHNLFQASSNGKMIPPNNEQLLHGKKMLEEISNPPIHNIFEKKTRKKTF